MPVATMVVATPIRQWPHIGTYSSCSMMMIEKVCIADRRHQQDRAHHAVAARLEVEHAAQPVVVPPESLAPLQQRASWRHRNAADDDPR